MYTHSRNIMECLIICSQEDKQQRYNELPVAIGLLIKNMQKVDGSTYLVPVEEGEAVYVWKLALVPYDHTDLGNWVMLSGGMNVLQMKKP